jgi:phosphohistidine phosphatase SixA
MKWVHLIAIVIALAIPLPTSVGCEALPTVRPQASQARSTGDSSLQVNLRSPSDTPAQANLWSLLRQGKGYTLLFRHALAPGIGDPANFRLDDCSTQRNLSLEGRQQAVRMGNTLRTHDLAIAKVLSSQWCRCLETARLMNVGPVTPFPVLNSFFQDRSTEVTQTEQLRQFILKHRDTSGVMVMVTHQVNITAISNIIPQPGAAVVMRASTPDQVELIGQLNPP